MDIEKQIEWVAGISAQRPRDAETFAASGMRDEFDEAQHEQGVADKVVQSLRIREEER